MRLQIRISLLCALVVLGAPAAAAGTDTLELNKARWAAANVNEYEYGYRKYCECHSQAPPETVVTVREGSVIGVRHRPAGTDLEVVAAEDNFQYYWTVEELFSLIATGLSRDAIVRVSYDSELGFPTQIYIDYGPEHLGDELDLRLTHLDRPGG